MFVEYKVKKKNNVSDDEDRFALWCCSGTFRIVK